MFAYTHHDLSAAFADRTSHLTQAQIDRFLQHDRIPPWSLAGAPGSGEHAVKAARVMWEDGGGFDFDPAGEPAFAILARGDLGDFADIVCFDDSRVGAWLGVPLLGWHNFTEPMLDPTLTIHATVREWLVDWRHGLVILDEAPAAGLFRDLDRPLRTDLPTGKRLQQHWRRADPRIVVAVPEKVAA